MQTTKKAAKTMTEKVDVETIIHEVLIKGEWVEWNRTDRYPGYGWDGQMIAAMRPQIRTRREWSKKEAKE